MLLLFLFALSLGNSLFSQDAYFDWVKQLDRRQGREEEYAIGVDNDKNIYLVGGYNNTIDVDPGPTEFNLSTVNNQEWDHVFITKLDPQGNFIWGKQFGGNRFANCTYFKVDPNGDLLLTGNFSGTTDFDPGPGTYNLTAIHTDGTENYDIYTLKLDKDGNFKWARSAGDLNAETGTSITTDLSGNVYTTGWFYGLTDFDQGPGVANIGKDGIENTFITKFSPQGDLIWAKEFSGNFHNRGTCIRTDNAGNIYLSGTSEGTTDFDPGPGVNSLVSQFYSREAYLAKLDNNGNLLWAKLGIGGEAFEVNSRQEVITWNYMATTESYLGKYDRNGKELWYRVMGGRESIQVERSSPMTLDAAGNIFLTGEFSETRDFDPGPGVYNMTADPGVWPWDAFIARLDQDGNFVWAKQFGNFSYEAPATIAVDTSGNIYSTGIYTGRVDFDPGPGIFEMQAYMGGGIYIHKMKPCPDKTYSGLNVATCTDYTLNGQTYFESGTYVQSLRNALGCDSLIKLNLILSKRETDVNQISCGSYNWNNQVITTSGDYSQSFTSIAGCDSLVHLHLTIKNPVSTTVNATICEGSQYEGYTTSGNYVDRFTSANGCDSTRTLILRVNPKKYTTLTITICSGETYAGYTTSGTYIDVFKSFQGCDSTRTLHLLVNPSYSLKVNKTICRGETYMNHSNSGTYTDRMQSSTGCDSTQTTVLTVLERPNPWLGKDTTLCPNDSLTLHAGKAETYLWQDGSVKESFTVRAPGNYTVMATNSCGSARAMIVIETNSCMVYFPNAFTPNQDGRNERFGILNAYNITDYHLRIYNRWGIVVFESRNPAVSWDGSYAGVKLETGIFIWQCSFSDNNTKQSRYMKGTVSLIR